MLASDAYAYVVKFQNNPQNLRVLAAEYFGTQLAALLKLSVPQCAIINVSSALIAATQNLTVVEADGTEVRCQAGRQFGSRLVGGLMPGERVDYLPESLLVDVKNLHEFIGILVFDKWTCNYDGRQAVFTKKRRRYTATFIDQGYCFGGGDWRLKDIPLRGVYGRDLPYSQVTGWKDFEPWISRLLDLESEKIWQAAESVPPEWYGGVINDMRQLVEVLLRRRTRITELIKAFRNSSRAPFPRWQMG